MAGTDGIGAAATVEVWRGPILESVHAAHAVVCDAQGAVTMAWGDPGAVIYPRSASKMVQALPLVESGAAGALGPERLALACASHSGASIHTGRVAAWLAEMGMGDGDLRCGAHAPIDRPAAEAMIRAGEKPAQVHNNCSGKHAGFLMLGRHLGAGPEYVAIDHPVQRAARAAFEEVTQEDSPGWGVDGCSAPNFACTLRGLARAMASFAAPGPGARGAAQARLVAAMMAHPDLVAGEGRACTAIMRAAPGRVAVKTGAEGVFVAILPDLRLGVAVKVADGAQRAAEAVIAAILARLGALDARAPVVASLSATTMRNWRGLETGRLVTRL